MSRNSRYLVTALCTVYKAERFMRGLLEDLEAQTIADRMQIVIVDSASPTSERAIIEEFQQRYDNIVYTRTDEREGILAAMNRALTFAEGTYVTPTSADDRHRHDAFEQLAALLEANPDVGFAYGDAAITHTENLTFEEAYAQGEVAAHFHWPDFDARHLFQVCCVGPQPMWRRALHDNVGGFDPAYVTAGDYDLYLRFAAAGAQFRHVPEVLGLYLLAPGGNEYSNLELSRVESDQARERHWPPSWGERPAPGGHYVVPMPAGVSSPAPPARGGTLLTREAAAVPSSPSGAGAVTAEALPLVSVIIPTRDRPEWLRRAVESVLGQTYPHVETIIVNDAGSDVGDLVQVLRSRGDITYVQLARCLERSAARNAGIRLARGSYIAYLDDDDWLHPHHIQTLVEAMISGDRAVAYSDAHRVLEEPQGTTYVTRGMDVPYSVPFDREQLRRGNYIPILCLMHRRDCLDRVGFFDETLSTHEDWDLFIRLSEAFDFVHVPQVTCGFSWRTDGSSTTSQRRADFERTAAIVAERYAPRAVDVLPASEPTAEPSSGVVRCTGEGPFVCSIVIPVFNKVELTTQCLTALGEVTDTPDFEVIVVDNGSTDGTAEFLTHLGGDVQVLRNERNLGFARACNQGAAVARGRHLVFLNNDTIPLANWLAPLVQEVEDDASVMMVGSKLLFPDGTIQHAGVAFSRFHRTPYHVYQRFPADAPEVNVRRELQAVTAACVLVRRSEFEAVQGFDEGFHNSFEDVDLCLRIKERGGGVVYQPASALVHLESQSAGRHDHDVANGRRLRERWAHRDLEDEDVIYAEHGRFLRSAVVQGEIALRLVDTCEADEEDAWRHLVATQRRVLAGDLTGVVPLLADPGEWPRDILVLQWAAGICVRAQRPDLAMGFLRHVLSLASLPDVHEALARLEEATTREGLQQGA